MPLGRNPMRGRPKVWITYAAERIRGPRRRSRHASATEEQLFCSRPAAAHLSHAACLRGPGEHKPLTLSIRRPGISNHQVTHEGEGTFDAVSAVMSQEGSSRSLSR